MVTIKIRIADLLYKEQYFPFVEYSWKFIASAKLPKEKKEGNGVLHFNWSIGQLIFMKEEKFLQELFTVVSVICRFLQSTGIMIYNF